MISIGVRAKKTEGQVSANFLEETDLRPGMDPEKATKLRQVRLDLHDA